VIAIATAGRLGTVRAIATQPRCTFAAAVALIAVGVLAAVL
jgi:hypothetical protein